MSADFPSMFIWQVIILKDLNVYLNNIFCTFTYLDSTIHFFPGLLQSPPMKKKHNLGLPTVLVVF